MPLDVINEASVFTVRTSFFGTAGSAQAPATARYRIRDLTNNRIVRDWTELVPAATIDISVTAEDNDIYQDKPELQFYFETRALVVQANYDTSTQYADEIRYLVKNLRGFES